MFTGAFSKKRIVFPANVSRSDSFGCGMATSTSAVLTPHS